MDMGLGRLWQLVMDREAWSAAKSHEESDMTEWLNWTELKAEKIQTLKYRICIFLKTAFLVFNQGFLKNIYKCI